MIRHLHRRRHLYVTIATCILATAFAAWSCGKADDGAARRVSAGTGPQPVRVWTIALRESDSLYLASPGDMASAPDDGSLFITDRFAGRVLQVRRDGEIVRTFGRKGTGPGEFTQLNVIFAKGDELFADDGVARAFHVFDRHTGSFRRMQRRHEGILHDIRLAGPTAWLGVQNRDRGTAIARWDLISDALVYAVPLPSEYRESQPLAGIYTGVYVVPWADSLLVALQGSNALYLATGDGVVSDTIDMPVRERRGVPADIVTRLKDLSFPEMFSAASGVFGLARMQDGRTAVVHFDQEISGTAITSEAYVSVLSADRRSACVDGRLSVSPDAQPRVMFRGDTLVVLEQRIVEGARAQTTVTGYVLDTRGCEWIPTG